MTKQQPTEKATRLCRTCVAWERDSWFVIGDKGVPGTCHADRDDNVDAPLLRYSKDVCSRWEGAAIAKQQPIKWIDAKKRLPPEHRIVEVDHPNDNGVRRAYMTDGFWRWAGSGSELAYGPLKWRYCI
jgi:hypothetical protein